MAYEIRERADGFSVYPKQRKVVRTTVEKGQVTKEVLSYASVFGGANPSTFDAEYEGDDKWDVDLDCGAQRWRGIKTTAEVRKALKNCGFNPFTIRALMKKYKVEPERTGPVELVKRGDPYASIVSQARLLDGSIWKILDDQPDNFEVVTRMYGPMENNIHERTIIKVPNDLIRETYRDAGTGLSWHEYKTETGNLWASCWRTYPKGIHLRVMERQEAIDYASYRHSSMYDPIYAFSSTGCIQSGEHRLDVMQSIKDSAKWTCLHWDELPLVWVDGDDGGPNSKHDLIILLNMLLYVANAPIDYIERPIGG